MPSQYQLILESLQKLSKEVRQKQILYTNTTPTGSVKCCYVLAVDNTTGDIFYKDDSDNWQPAPSGGGGCCNLQDVTDVGSNTDNNISITAPDDTQQYGFTVFNRFSDFDIALLIDPTLGGSLTIADNSNHANISILRTNPLTASNRNQLLPDGDGTLVLTVNNIAADNQGNVDIAAGIGGSGTVNHIARFTPDGNTLGDSLLVDLGGIITGDSTVGTGTGFYFTTSTLTTGNLMRLASGGTSADGSTILRIESTGSNAASGKTAFGEKITVNNTGKSSTNVGLSVSATGATTNYALKLVDGSEGASKVLTSDASGNASWQTGGSFALTNGSGTTASGTSVNLGGSQTGNVSIDANGSLFNIMDGSLFDPLNFTFDGILNSVYLDNNSHTGLFGINTSTPTGTLDANSGTNQIFLTDNRLDLGDFNTDLFAGMEFDKAAHTIQMAVDGGTQTFSITSAGIGINNTSPTVALDVVGSAAINMGTIGTVDLGDNSGAGNFNQLHLENSLWAIGDGNGAGNSFISGDIGSGTISLDASISVSVSTLQGTGSRAVLADASGVLSASGASFHSYRVVTTTGNILVTDYTVSINNTITTITLTLPNATGNIGQIFIIKRKSSTDIGLVTINTSGGNIEDPTSGAYGATYSLPVIGNPYSTIQVQSNGTDYEVIN